RATNNCGGRQRRRKTTSSPVKLFEVQLDPRVLADQSHGRQSDRARKGGSDTEPLPPLHHYSVLPLVDHHMAVRLLYVRMLMERL
ncbi:hypothetical protein GBAR_LOCUS9637, partial [Geodia barretti]